jgi:23S rRNA pseudouridine1911/1915/1917 synthase
LRRDLLVGAEQAGLSLDAFIASALAIDLEQARAIIASGSVFSSGKRAKRADAQLESGARIVVHLSDERTPERPPIVVLFEDEELIVIDKLPGDHVNETETSKDISIVERLRGHAKDLFVVHRLDKETSGVLVLAKGKASSDRLSEAFRSRAVDKRYLALVEGSIADGTISAPIAPDRRRPRARRVLRDGKPSETEVRTLSRVEGVSAIEAHPITGRTHQIRVHLSHRGAPILGDRLYGGPTAIRLGDETFSIERSLLHAARLTLPIAGGTRTFEAPVPPDMARFARHGLVLDLPSA